MARLSACSAEETRTFFMKPSIIIPDELRHTQAIDPSNDLATKFLSKLLHLLKFLSICCPPSTSDFGSGRHLLKTWLFLAFQIFQNTTETSSNSVGTLVKSSSLGRVWSPAKISGNFTKCPLSMAKLHVLVSLLFLFSLSFC
ncbi:uncharacterized protein LOC130137111 [Syzygium oleosum]|uniref:uncharacterized protein LOC130135594 n=1 Tax=Syzygium oleosum TaxID=219896 RepID=UPI0024B8D4B1|nr:uncharacterized protein LOC130135594 [Syzygium oleosum]XP_056163830.1 uncharacterized protein LOC130137111 [Syzygium oleosum]